MRRVRAGGAVRTAVFLDAGEVVVQADSRRRRGQGAVRCWDVRTGQQLSSLSTREITDLAFDAAQERAVLLEDYPGRSAVRLLLRDGDSWRRTDQELSGGAIRGVCFDATFAGPDSVLVCDSEGAVVLWDLASGEHLRLPADDAPRFPGVVYDRWQCAASTADAATIWCGGAPGYLHRFDRQEDGSYREAPPLQLGESVHSICLLPAGRGLLVGGEHGMLERVALDRTRESLPGHRAYVVRSLAWTQRDGELWFASGE